ncbi:hypothetical protein LUZ61_005078 [Rhynchospora tenuis]|uniref:Uncharacterized protein n=1 Tax=Rhynchospora tenuis TaxID=198213 RepID=A0AAD5ZP46_9POAL|nr:hypothetical protein LUZ61_005078 [Rhynchospora tenuis]
MANVGVCYGRDGDNIPLPRETVNLCRSKQIRAMRIYGPDHDILEALKGTGIRLIMHAPGPDAHIQALREKSYAADWVKENIKKFDPDVSFKYIAVGNEVEGDDVDHILPAMMNIHSAIKAEGLERKIKVSTVVKSDVLTPDSYPPSNAKFKDNRMVRIVQFLSKNGAPLLANIYPYFAYVREQANISLAYALFKGGHVDGNYENLFDAMVDSMYYALEKAKCPDVKVVVSETGWPSDGGVGDYNQNVINHVPRGTPKRPGELETYIFAMFNENTKPIFANFGSVEHHFGLFDPVKRKLVYPINFK